MKLKPQFTPFQLKVYAAIKKIPKGQVRSYRWVAKAIGRPKAYRAVGNALNKNPRPYDHSVGRARPVIVPCHRVVKSDGSLGGFSRGLGEKIRLLKAEGLTMEKIRDIIKSRNSQQKGKICRLKT